MIIKLEENKNKNYKKKLFMNNIYLKEIQDLCRKIKKEDNKQIKLFLNEQYKDYYKNYTVTFSYTYYYLNNIKNIFNKIPNSITDVVFTHSKTLLNTKSPQSFKPLKKDYIIHNLSNKLRNITNITYGNIILDFDYLPSSLLTAEESFTGNKNTTKQKITIFNLPNKILLIKYNLDKEQTIKFKKCPSSLKYIML